MTPNEAQQVLTDLADDLTRRLHAKGYETARAEIWLGHGYDDRRVHIYIDHRPVGLPYVTYQRTVDEAVAATNAAIDALSEQGAHALAVVDMSILSQEERVRLYGEIAA